jgi:CBS domain-containing protein
MVFGHCRVPMTMFCASAVQGGMSVDVCSRSTALHEVLRVLVEGRLHRIYVVDDQQHPEGIITLTDILCFVSKLPRHAA